MLIDRLHAVLEVSRQPHEFENLMLVNKYQQQVGEYQETEAKESYTFQIVGQQNIARLTLAIAGIELIILDEHEVDPNPLVLIENVLVLIPVLCGQCYHLALGMTESHYKPRRSPP